MFIIHIFSLLQDSFLILLSSFSIVEEKPGSASSRKEKEKDGLKSPISNDLVEVKTSGYSKK